jgi:EAL domain-containing protein (putative c-di-GMP-specific phosphodiesterase class I)
MRPELLIRMRYQDGGYLSPGTLLPAAERYQLMSDIDRCVIRNAVNSRRNGQKPGRELHVSINLSGQSIGAAGLLAYVIQKLASVGACASQVCFEATETVAVNNPSLAISFIETIKRLGCKSSFDDCGAGISSFGHLKGCRCIM